jgi:hypothetical protein
LPGHRPCLSWGWVAFEVLFADHPATYWVHRIVGLKPVSMPERHTMIDRSPRNQGLRVHPSVTSLPFRVPKLQSPAQYLSASGLYLPKVLALFATSPGASTWCGGSKVPATVRPQVFSTSRRFAPRFGFAGLLHPAATSRVRSCSGVSLLVQPSFLIERLLPPCRQHLRRSPAETSCHTRDARLRGFTPHEAAFAAVWG